MPCRRHGVIAARGSSRFFAVRHLGAPKATGKGQDGHLSSRRRDTRAPSACLHSQPTRLPGHAASARQQLQAWMHTRRPQETFASASQSFGAGFKRRLPPFRPPQGRAVRSCVSGRGGSLAAQPWGQEVHTPPVL